MHENMNVALEWKKDDVAIFPNFMSAEECQKVIDYFEAAGEHWMQTCFYDSVGMALVPDDDILEQSGLEDIQSDYFNNLRNKFKKHIEYAFDREVKNNSSHAQKWPTGAFARWHSDSSDLEGNPSPWSDNKYASILYLNDNYEGGELVFRDFDLSLKLPTGTLIAFPGGVENIHKVEEITGGQRFTIVGFWDYADSVYTEEEMRQREEQIAIERVRQKEQKAEWAAGNKDA